MLQGGPRLEPPTEAPHRAGWARKPPPPPPNRPRARAGWICGGGGGGGGRTTPPPTKNFAPLLCFCFCWGGGGVGGMPEMLLLGSRDDSAGWERPSTNPDPNQLSQVRKPLTGESNPRTGQYGRHVQVQNPTNWRV